MVLPSITTSVSSASSLIDAAVVLCDRNAVGRLDPLDLSHDFVRDGIDDVDVIAGGVRLDDPQLRLLRICQRNRYRAQKNPSESRETPAKRLLARHGRHPSFQR